MHRIIIFITVITYMFVCSHGYVKVSNINRNCVKCTSSNLMKSARRVQQLTTLNALKQIDDKDRSVSKLMNLA